MVVRQGAATLAASDPSARGSLVTRRRRSIVRARWARGRAHAPAGEDGRRCPPRSAVTRSGHTCGAPRVTLRPRAFRRNPPRACNERPGCRVGERERDASPPRAGRPVAATLTPGPCSALAAEAESVRVAAPAASALAGAASRIAAASGTANLIARPLDRDRKRAPAAPRRVLAAADLVGPAAIVAGTCTQRVTPLAVAGVTAARSRSSTRSPAKSAGAPEQARPSAGWSGRRRRSCRCARPARSPRGSCRSPRRCRAPASCTRPRRRAGSWPSRPGGARRT